MIEHETDPGVDTDEGAASAEDPRLGPLVAALGSDEPAERRAAAESLAEIGQAAAPRLCLALVDPRLDLRHRLRAGNLLGRVGDPRLTGPEGLGPLADVPAGPFLMGATAGEPEADTNALPQHEVDVGAFRATRFNVTNVAFGRFVADGGYGREDLWLPEGWAWRAAASIVAPHYWPEAVDRPNHPVVGVSWFEALAYCRWLTERLEAASELQPGEVARLPTEAEWEKAARGGLTLDRRRAQPNPKPDRRHPWGDAFVANTCNTAEAELGGTSPVGMFPDGESPYRVEGLGGNVMEWCSSRPTAYPYHAHDGREDPAGGVRTYRIARGGAFPFKANSARCAYRHWNHPDFRGGMIGFRVVRGRPAG